MSTVNEPVVMVTGVGGGGNGEQLLKALRMSDLNYRIVGGDSSPLSIGLCEVDYPYILPAASDPDYLECVLGVCAKHNVRALFTGSEAELRILSRNRSAIEAAGIFLPMNPPHVIDLCLDKVKTMMWLQENGFSCPRWITVGAIEDLRKVDFMPAVLKPSVGGGGSTNAFIAQDEVELEAFAMYLLKGYSQFIVQEYVGTPDSEYTVGVLLDMNGNLINSIAVKKTILSGLSNRCKIANRTGRGSVGEILAISSGVSQGEVGAYPEVRQECERIASALGCRGAVNIQCRLSEGRVCVFEINPRFSGTSSLRAMVGYNEPDVLIRIHLLQEKVEPHFSYRHGSIMRGLREVFIEDRLVPDARELL